MKTTTFDSTVFSACSATRPIPCFSRILRMFSDWVLKRMLCANSNGIAATRPKYRYKRHRNTTSHHFRVTITKLCDHLECFDHAGYGAQQSKHWYRVLLEVLSIDKKPFSKWVCSSTTASKRRSSSASTVWFLLFVVNCKKNTTKRRLLPVVQGS